MKKLRLLAVAFDTHLHPWELPRFRGAVAAKVGLEHDWFHNHDNEGGGFHHRYPKIQYKLHTRDGQMRPMLLCIDEGVEEAHHFFSHPNWDLVIGQQAHVMRIASLDVRQHTLQVWDDGDFRYHIHKWLALNAENFAEWQRTESLAGRVAMLERLLAAHILSFARGVGCEFERHLEVRITRLQRDDEWVSYKDVKILAFTLEFGTNASLPDWVGLGKGASMGFGVLRQQRKGR
ncbi:MAG: CRISPR-associated endonuclease Cas6 [Saprospiraceae bacterium]